MSNIDQPSPAYIINIGLNLPVTSSFALPLAGYYTWLQYRVISNRIRAKQSIAQFDPKSATSREPDRLLAACRAQANFAENVPLALTISALVEANGGSKRVLTAALSVLCVARVLHADFGIMAKNNMDRGRPVGFFSTVAVVLGMAGYGAYLARGSWGF
ncbi:hypothetical protein CLAFUW4_05748 [Fulvia fulva]|uniref:Uncharacterized protein n=1 Tax=Passalora fulva TaxID=5499 RepID=A0A9Q8P9A3_PASFU|nr:uncharacterized protein CLAFUR5_05891 [Fulvia fulva]KAK4624270.1 hypothetical protein CLAFUR4_05742 [Fulvia fulva]KAK4625052.1 hypothetical protein CLAFUR0_05753 [Fulvia fulva]UJO18059.1 hypothetical protein CLAFUR5_05891 [Fulvia fulva]WPV14896.1 hypothetical protein CLAFUW4_05748 [Fulvia fulva]WPV30355.1 hypothetical protein CLAFUW7_05746 [Fulvia fulva]